MLKATFLPAARPVLISSTIARLPLAMLPIALLIHAEHLSGSFAVAGLVGGAYAVATGVGGPVLGRLIDRRGIAPVLVPSAIVATALLVAAAALPVGAGAALQLLLAAAIGATTPPLAACVRSLIPSLVRDADKPEAAYGFDSIVVELTWILGPPLALGLATLTSSGGAVAGSGAIMLLATAVFVAQAPTRAWRPVTDAPPRARGGSLRAPGLQTLVLVMTAVGLIIGTVEVGVVAAAEDLGSAVAAGPLIGIWSVGSLLGGIVVMRRGHGARGARGLALIVAALGLGHLAVAGATGSLVALALTLLVANVALAPACATVYAMVERLVPAGTVTEAFAWLSTATAVGTAAGAATAGALADGPGAHTAFLVAGIAGVLAAAAAVLRSRTLGEPVATPLLAAAAS